jgi:hypothetical protein
MKKPQVDFRDQELGIIELISNPTSSPDEEKSTAYLEEKKTNLTNSSEKTSRKGTFDTPNPLKHLHSFL